MNKMELIETKKLFCGETPVYDSKTDSLIWINTGNPFIYILDMATGEIESKNLDFTLEGLVPRENGGWIAPTNNSIILMDNKFSVEKELKNILPETPALAIHDCTAGPDGRLYVSTSDAEDYMRPKGEVFRLDSDLQFDSVLKELALPNGSGFSPDGKTFYLNEMMGSRILAFDFEAPAGSFSNRRTLCDIDPEKGYPDGLTIDSEGCLWIGMWQGFGIIRFDPKGNIIEEIEAPVPTPTCMAFGGDDLKTIYITSAIKGLSDEQLKEYPASGSLFKIQTEIKGLAEKTFGLK